MLSKYFNKLYDERWVIGITRADIKDIIRSKTFNPDINWLPVKSKNKFYADPFILKRGRGNYDILFEEYDFKKDYGIISLMTIDERFRQLNHKMVLDTGSHLSYPFTFAENNKTYVFPEAAQSGKLSCYEYDPVSKSLEYLQDVIDLPLLDGTILKHNDIYWLFGILRMKDSYEEYKLCIFFAGKLLGPYTPHPKNPVKNSLNGTRSAGNFIEVDGVFYRPTQDCRNKYGESITINRVNVLNDLDVSEEFYMSININRKNRNNWRIRTIHTINVVDDIIVVDGMKSRFSPIRRLRKIAWKSFLSVNSSAG